MRAVIADDSVLLREGIAGLLANAGFEVVATVGTADALLQAVGAHEPDIAIVDIRMPPTHTDEGLRAAIQLRHDHPELAILLLSQWVHAGQALDLFRNGARLGYLLKDRVIDVDDFLEALRRLAKGGTVLDPDVVTALVDGVNPGQGALRRLTDRESQVLALMAEGRSNNAIAERLYLGRKTVETHVNAIFTKLGLDPASDDNRRVLAVLTWLRAEQ
ncbi:response regulator transcription factor [Streptosporangium sp. KLBMP 9127]|nr:response regulator transcription factor [Streptosporangium sp. KLBMP 9127]